MSTTTEQVSVGVQGDLWGEKARDWADVLEGWSGWGIPLYRHMLERVPVDSQTSLLDVGCGAGRFCRMAADRGARVAGIDAAAPLVNIARERVPEGDFRVGDLQALPWTDGSFDVVTGFNSFFYADDLVKALGEAGRVSRAEGHVVVTCFGRPERCESTPVFGALGELVPPDGESTEESPSLAQEGVLEQLAVQAGLTPKEAGYVNVPEEYPDLETMLRGYLAAGPMVRVIRAVGEDAVREALTTALAPLRNAKGGYRLEDEIRYLIALAH